VDKDAHDIYRLLTAIPTDKLASSLRYLRRDELAAEVTGQAIAFLGSLFASGSTAIGSVMAGRAEEGVGEPQTVAASVAILAADLVSAITDD
jgi:hypothetical protein